MLATLTVKTSLLVGMAFIIQTLCAQVPTMRIAPETPRMPAIEREVTDDYLDQHQGTSQCVDDLEALHGEHALVRYGEAFYTITNICDFE